MTALKVMRIVAAIWTLLVLLEVVFIKASIITVASLVISAACTAFLWLALG